MAHSSQKAMSSFQLEDVSITLIRKKIKHVYLRVYPPDGRVCISAPRHMPLAEIRSFAQSRWPWIQTKRAQCTRTAQAPLQFCQDELHPVWGKSYPLHLVAHVGKPEVRLHSSLLEIHIHPQSSCAQRQKVLETWYRQQLQSEIAALVAFWEPRMQVQVHEFRTKKMRTKWGTCNCRAKRIWLNLALAQKPISCLELIVVHEMVHLLERSHNSRFYALMDHFLPDWKNRQHVLQQSPFSI